MASGRPSQKLLKWGARRKATLPLQSYEPSECQFRLLRENNDRCTEIPTLLAIKPPRMRTVPQDQPSWPIEAGACNISLGLTCWQGNLLRAEISGRTVSPSMFLDAAWLPCVMHGCNDRL
jgi:hypothetical protein